MEEVINILEEVRKALQNLEHFVPTEHNCKQILGSIQRIDIVCEYLQHVHIESEEEDAEQEN